MAFKLTKAQVATKADLHRRLEAAAQRVSEAIGSYNWLLADVRALADDIVELAEGEFEEKSGRWQEGDKGSAARDWIDAWAEADFEDLDEPDFHADALNELPEAAE